MTLQGITNKTSLLNYMESEFRISSMTFNVAIIVRQLFFFNLICAGYRQSGGNPVLEVFVLWEYCAVSLGDMSGRTEI